MSTPTGEPVNSPPRAIVQPDLRRSDGRWRIVLESVLIVASVLFGFVLSNWGERSADRKLANAALANFRHEIQSNLAELQRVHPKHVQFAERLKNAAVTETAPAATAFDAFANLLPEGGLDTPALREAAWEVAVSTGALRLLDYEVAARLSETYLIQRSTLMPTSKLLSERFHAMPNYDPAARRTMVRVHQMLVNELAGQEAFLIDVYRKTLEALPPVTD